MPSSCWTAASLLCNSVKKKLKILLLLFSEFLWVCSQKKLIFKDRWGKGKFHIINTNTNTYVVILGLWVSELLLVEYHLNHQVQLAID